MVGYRAPAACGAGRQSQTLGGRTAKPVTHSSYTTLWDMTGTGAIVCLPNAPPGTTIIYCGQPSAGGPLSCAAWRPCTP